MRIFLLILLLIIVACGPSNQQLQNDFSKLHPGAKVISADPGEGDSDNVYIHFRYKENEGAEEKEEIWLYQRLNGEWQSRGQVQKH